MSKEIWWLALVTLINRAGTMVIPFLSLYFNENLGFSLENIGMLMTSFGIGSLMGSWLGGKLTDTYGYYRVMYLSLIVSGFLFISFQFLEDFWNLALGVFLLMTVAEVFRPASFVAINAYSKPENRTRSVTLIRLAINLGFSIGPALGGLFILYIGYTGLFWADGCTCIIAGILILLILNPKKINIQKPFNVKNPRSAYKDIPYLVFIGSMILLSFAFVQYFSTVPIYYSEAYQLSEYQIGLLLAMNGIFIFLFEMPLIKYIEYRKIPQVTLILLGLLLIALSFLIFNLFAWTGILVVAMLFMTWGEMIAFPFSNAFAMARSQTGNPGEYMALYSISFSISHIFAHNMGMRSVASFGYEFTWYVMVVACLLGILLLLLLQSMLNKKYEKLK